MSKGPESRVKLRVKKVLTSLGACYSMPSTGGYGQSGTLDFVACLRGRYIEIECKAGGNQLTLLQKKRVELVEKAGGIVEIVDEHVSEEELILKLIYKLENPSG